MLSREECVQFCTASRNSSSSFFCEARALIVSEAQGSNSSFRARVPNSILGARLECSFGWKAGCCPLPGTLFFTAFPREFFFETGFYPARFNPRFVCEIRGNAVVPWWIWNPVPAQTRPEQIIISRSRATKKVERKNRVPAKTTSRGGHMPPVQIVPLTPGTA